MKGASDGIRVIECGMYQFGPEATCLLGDLGAEVIKIEPPVHGDPGRGVTRILGTFDCSLPSGGSAYFQVLNRSKKSVTLDIRKEKGKEILCRLVEKSDVFVQNFRGGVAERVGIDYERLRQVNPRIIYVSATGFGLKGPEGTSPSLDAAGQARSGLMYAFGKPDDPPLLGSGGPADQMGAVITAYGVLAALVARERQGIGQHVETSHLNSCMWLLALPIGMELVTGGLRKWPRFSRDKAGSAAWNYYRCSDDKWLLLSIFQVQRYWGSLCKALGLDQMGSDPRFDTDERRIENREELISILDKTFATRTSQEWDGILKEHDLLYSRIQDTQDLLNDPQVIANEYVVDVDHPALGKVKMLNYPIRLSETPGGPRSPAPELGQHTEEVLTDVAGYSWEEIAELQDARVI